MGFVFGLALGAVYWNFFGEQTKVGFKKLVDWVRELNTKDDE